MTIKDIALRSRVSAINFDKIYDLCVKYGVAVGNREHYNPSKGLYILDNRLFCNPCFGLYKEVHTVQNFMEEITLQYGKPKSKRKYIVVSSERDYKGEGVYSARVAATHDTEESALAEAKRLALVEPKREFYVMKSVTRVRVADAPLEVTDA